MKLLIPDTVEFALDPIDGVQIIEYQAAERLPVEHEDAEALVAWGNSDAWLSDVAQRLTRLRWVQTLSAGTDQMIASGFAPQVAITSGRSLQNPGVAEHALALALAGARRIHTLTRAQLGHRWAAEIGGRQPIRDPERVTTLRDAHVVVWGFGSIAQTLAPMLTALGSRVTGVARSAGERGGYPVIAEADVDSILPSADVLIMIMPSTPQTRHLLNAKRLALLSHRTWVVNVGRGTTIDEAALIDALRAERIAGAALDVTEIEPLPLSSPLWDLPNVIITPHTAGGRPVGAADLVRDNAIALRDGQPLANTIAR
ncbi:NAD(P)-dependent oxidoreductase [Salinibacterium sp. ZJ77]|uniref:NAD(P)-dependent oxidoreductase n=1 Tax=Salinibacterium sp. ZJ77 TaxID=2708337 RepID=UPI0014216CD5|nr:NAD(P)-dependent oxidoreductase [Salinibacterium sp. ZJ77]